MNKAYTRINWKNYTDTSTPLNETNLNKVDLALDTVDDRVVSFDLTKAEQSDLLGCLSGVAYDTTSGIFTFTYKNGTTFTADINIEKIPVSFSMSADGIITMTTTDGTTYTADVASLIKTYSFTNTDTIGFEVTSDSDGNKTIKANVVDGSITSAKLQQNYLADITAQANRADTAKTNSESSALVSEGWAVGTQNGVPVTSESQYYENNALYYKNQAEGIVGLEVIDNLTSTSTTDALSANQGRVLKGMIEDIRFTVSLSNPTEIDIMPGNGKLSLYWKDPDDVIIGSSVIATWESTTIVRKTGAAPTSATDGTVVAVSTVRDAYHLTPLEDTGLENGTTYYYGFFPRSTEGIYNTNVTASATPEQSSVTLTLTIEGAKEDTIAITDPEGSSVGTVVFPSGSTTGTTSIIVPAAWLGDDQHQYTFTSSVAKATDGSGSDYSKTITLTNSSTNVKVMPDIEELLAWYGNRVDIVPLSEITWSSYWSPKSSTIHDAEDGIYYKCVNDYTYSTWVYFEKVNLSNYSKIKLKISNPVYLASSPYRCGGIALYSSKNQTSYVSAVNITSTSIEFDVSSYSGEYYIAVYCTDTNVSYTLDTLWLE